MKTRDMSASISLVRPLNLSYHCRRNGPFDRLVPTSVASFKITTTVTFAYQIHIFQSPKGPMSWVKTVKCCSIILPLKCYTYFFYSNCQKCHGQIGLEGYVFQEKHETFSSDF